MSLFLILLAAGDSKRLKTTTPKPFLKINNVTLLEHTINAFKNIPEIKKTVVVYHKKHKKYLNKLNLKNVLKIKGGKTRQESTFNALKKIKKMQCKTVLIHDAARPNPSKKMIKNIILQLKKNHAVIPFIKTSDAVKRVENKIIFKNIERNTLGFAQTPQGFTFKKIYEKHLKNTSSLVDDDASLFTNDEENVVVIHGSKRNLKITDREDLEMFKTLKKSKSYVGIGFDVHKLVEGKRFFLGGLKIKSNLGTLGHSDGDPVLHALIDALLGACQMGDIGQMFSNKNKNFKNIRSTLLLKKVIKLTKLNKCFINNLDINIILQSPKILKYKKKMIENISKLCEISKNQINIKGKTTEKLGVIGKEKAVACEVIISVNKYD